MTAIIPFGQKVALRVGKVLYRSKSSFRYKVHFLKLIHFRKSNKESIKLNQFEDMTQVVDGFSNFFKKVFKSGTFSSKDFSTLEKYLCTLRLNFQIKTIEFLSQCQKVHVKQARKD